VSVALRLPEVSRVRSVFGGSLKYYSDPYFQKQTAQIREFIHSERPLVLEIGFARGQFLLGTAKALPEFDFIGFEVRKKWVEQTASHSAMDGLHNVRVCQGDARFLCPLLIPDQRLSAVFVLFPDPWWKGKQRRQRLLLTPEFMREIARTLIPGGTLTVKTDVLRYAQQVRQDAQEVPDLEPIGPHEDPFAVTPDRGILTSREERCRREGLLISHLVYRKKPTSNSDRDHNRTSSIAKSSLLRLAPRQTEEHQ